jgi:hypothetical protein
MGHAARSVATARTLNKNDFDLITVQSVWLRPSGGVRAPLQNTGGLLRLCIVYQTKSILSSFVNGPEGI